MTAQTKQSDQLARFVETARKLECDEDKERFEAALGKIASNKPAPPLKKSRMKREPTDGR
jgi:hypothetical protein